METRKELIEYKDLNDLYKQIGKMVYKTLVDLREPISIWFDDLVQDGVIHVVENPSTTYSQLKTFLFQKAKYYYQKEINIVYFEDAIEYSCFSIVSNFSITARDVSRAILSIKNKKHRIIIASLLSYIRRGHSLRRASEILARNDRFWSSYLFLNTRNRASAIQNALNRAIYKKRKRK
jgi:hypothetical protein